MAPGRVCDVGHGLRVSPHSDNFGVERYHTECIFKFLIRWINNFSTVDTLQLPHRRTDGGRKDKSFLLNYLLFFGGKFIRFGVEIFFCPLPGLSLFSLWLLDVVVGLTQVSAGGAK
jgi:hypothetical protein